MNKNELEEFLKYHDHLYYDLDSPEISDIEYNKYKDEYVEKYGEYNYVPGNVSNKFEKYEHSTYVSSLDKKQITDTEGIKKELERLWPVIIQPKMDGLTIVTYPSGTHVTRGNGHIGEVVTNNVNKAEGLGKPFSAYPVRSELVMLHSYFDKINKERIEQGLKPYENCRNAAAGMIRNLDDSKIEGLKIFAYNVLFEEDKDDYEEDSEEEQEESNPSAQTQIDYLKLNNWNTVDSYEPKDIDDAINYINNYDRTILDYDIDGLVIKHNGNKKFGQTEHHPLNAIAIKFKPEGDWTKINDIQWTVGRTGKVTPIAILEPINVMGSTITKATLHNPKIMEILDLSSLYFKGKGEESLTEAYVIKANDVIPRILEIKHPKLSENNLYLKKIEIPCECPICKSKLRKENDQLYCDNDNCSSKIINRLIHLSQRDAFNIESLGEETAIKLIDLWKDILTKTKNSEEIQNEMDNIHPSFIYRLTKEQLLNMEGFKDKSVNKLYSEIQKSKEITFDKFLYGCGIPLVGKKVARDIAEFYYDPNSDLSELEYFVSDYYEGFEKLIKVNGIGKSIIDSIVKYYDSYIVPFGNYIKILDYIPKKKSTNQLKFVITGSFDISREEIKEIIENSGHKIVSSISSKTDYVLVGKDPGTKAIQAKEKNISIINSLDELNKIIN